MLKMLIGAIEELDEEETLKIVKRCVAAGISKNDIWKALNQGLQRVGIRYEQEEYSIADLMVVGIIFENVLESTKIDIYEDIEEVEHTGRILLGTVEGDIHDIGKSIFKGAMQAAGFIVEDIGVNVKADVFLKYAQKNHYDIIGISAVLTDSIPYVKEVIEIFDSAGMRDDLKIIIGGCIANKTVSDFVKADAYTKSAIRGVDICREWLQL